MTLRMLPGPLVGWLSMIMFLLVMQFLIKYLPDLVGKGLPVGVVIELIAYNLAYMLVLAVPMAVLVSALMTFGRIAETGAYAVMKSAGVSFRQLVWPFLLVGLLLTAGMGYFNNVVLPEANFRARTLWLDIRTTRPGFELKPGVFYDGLDDYMILVRNLPPDAPDRLEDVVIYDYSEGPRYRTDIKAARGILRPVDGGRYLSIDLFDGEVHRKRPTRGENADRYERMAFDRHRLRIEMPDLGFERTDPARGRRTDRTMPSWELARIVDSLETGLAESRARLHAHSLELGRRPDSTRTTRAALPRPETASGAVSDESRPALAGLDSLRRAEVVEQALQNARAGRSVVENARHTIQRSEQRADQLRVEIHKKNSIALACLVFMLIGAPLGLSIRRGGLGMAAAIALGIFMFYWVTLVNGEKLADRGLLAPWLGMWAANMVSGVLGAWLALSVGMDRRAIPTAWSRLRNRLRRATGEPEPTDGTTEAA